MQLAMPSSLDDPRILNWLRARKATARIASKPYLHNPRLASQLQQIQCRALVLWGSEDRLIPLAHGEYFAENIPGATLKVFPQCGHMLPYEKTDQFVAEVFEFLDG